MDTFLSEYASKPIYCLSIKHSPSIANAQWRNAIGLDLSIKILEKQTRTEFREIPQLSMAFILRANSVKLSYPVKSILFQAIGRRHDQVRVSFDLPIQRHFAGLNRVLDIFSMPTDKKCCE